jgi:4-hydroxysphinganine ceramide fatty acyl 2-hydroxylase
MNEESIHVHSKLAFDMLDAYQIGTLDDASVSPTANHGKAEGFIDITKPMFMQVLNSSWTREFYLVNGISHD